MLWGNRHYISGFDTRTINNTTGEVGVGMVFTCFTACIATAFGFYVSSVSGSAKNYYVGIRQTDDQVAGSYHPIGDKDDGWVDGEYRVTPISSDGWQHIVSDTGWSLKAGSAYAIVIYGTKDASSPNSVDYCKIMYSTPITEVKIHNGSSDPQKKVAWTDNLSEEFWQYTAVFMANPIYYIKGKIGGVDGAYQDGCCYTELLDENISTGEFNLTDGVSKVWASMKIYLDATTYGYDPVLINIYIRGRTWTGANSPNASLNYHILDGSDTMVASSEIFNKDGYSNYSNLDWTSTPISVNESYGWTSSAISFQTGQVYRFVFRPKNTSGYYGLAGIQGTTTGVSEYGFYQGTSAAIEKSTDSGDTWTHPEGRGVCAPVMFDILSVVGSVTGFNGRSTAGLSAATVTGFNNSAVTDETGSYDLIVNSTAGDDNVLNFSFFNFSMIPNEIDYGTIYKWRDIKTTFQSSLKEFHEKWWDFDTELGQGKHYAFRKAINFGDSHSTYASGYVHKESFQTGKMVPFVTDCENNEGVHLSGDHGQMFYYKGKTYIAYRNKDSKATVTEYNYAGDSFGNKINLGYMAYDFGGPNIYTDDTHYQPTIIVDASGYPWCFFTKHGGPVEYRKSDTIESIDGTWSEPDNVPSGGISGTYLRPRVNPVTGDIWLLNRYGITGSILHMQRFVHSTRVWEPDFAIASFYEDDGTAEGWNSNDKALYIGGFRFDDRGYAYISACYLQNYGGVPQHEVANQCFYTPELSSVCKFYSIDGTEVSDLTNSEYIHWNTLLTTCSLNFYTNTSDPATGITYPKGGTNEDRMQFLDGIFNNGTHDISIPAIGWVVKMTSTGYPSYPVISYWHTAPLSEGWKHKYVCSALSGKEAYSQPSPRLMGGFVIDDSNIAHYYGYFEPKTSTSAWNVDYAGFTFVHYKSNNDLTTSTGFIPEIVFQNSFSGVGNGIMRMEFKDNYILEGIICNHSNLYHYFEKERNYGFVKPDKTDLCVVHNNTEIPCVVDNVNSRDSNVYFKLQDPLSGGNVGGASSNPYYTHYYMYYGNQSSAFIASSNPSDMWEIYDNFEQYETDVTVSALSDPYFQWSVRNSSGEAFTSTNMPIHIVSHSSFNFLGLSGVDPSVALAGQRSCVFWNDTDNFSELLSTVVCATSIPSDMQDSMTYKLYVKGRQGNSDVQTFAGLITKGGHTVVGMSCGDSVDNYYLFKMTGPNYNKITFSEEGNHRANQYQEYEFRVSKEHGIRCVFNGITAFTVADGKSGISTAFFGCCNCSGIKKEFFDFVRISPFRG